jgi:hypothetical protein
MHLVATTPPKSFPQSYRSSRTAPVDEDSFSLANAWPSAFGTSLLACFIIHALYQAIHGRTPIPYLIHHVLAIRQETYLAHPKSQCKKDVVLPSLPPVRAPPDLM